jgi:hypothetical protein
VKWQLRLFKVPLLCGGRFGYIARRKQQVKNSGIMVSSRQVVNVVCIPGGFVLYGCEIWSVTLREEHR